MFCCIAAIPYIEVVHLHLLLLVQFSSVRFGSVRLGSVRFSSVPFSFICFKFRYSQFIK